MNRSSSLRRNTTQQQAQQAQQPRQPPPPQLSSPQHMDMPLLAMAQNLMDQSGALSNQPYAVGPTATANNPSAAKIAKV
jgi:hypothetical protein